MQINIEELVRNTILQEPKEVNIHGRIFKVAPPSAATIIEASAIISKLPQESLDHEKVVSEALFVAKDCRPLGDILATIILGAKHLTETVKIRRFWLFRRTVVFDMRAELSKWLLDELSPAEMNRLFRELLKDLQLGDFFGTTTFLIEINQLRPKKVVTTAFGQ